MNTEPSLSILVVDDHDLVRAGVAAVAEQLARNTRVLSAASIAEGVSVLENHPEIDLVLLDLALPDAVALSGLDEILRTNPDVPIILLTADERRETMEEAFRKGASGYIPKSSNMQIIMNALRIILAGGRYLPGEMLERINLPAKRGNTEMPTGEVATTPSDNQPRFPERYGLTPRQTSVAELLRRGLSNKEICRELDLGISTVKTHVASILRASRTSSRAKAIALLSKTDNTSLGD